MSVLSRLPEQLKQAELANFDQKLMVSDLQSVVQSLQSDPQLVNSIMELRRQQRQTEQQAQEMQAKLEKQLQESEQARQHLVVAHREQLAAHKKVEHQLREDKRVALERAERSRELAVAAEGEIGSRLRDPMDLLVSRIGRDSECITRYSRELDVLHTTNAELTAELEDTRMRLESHAEHAKRLQASLQDVRDRVETAELGARTAEQALEERELETMRMQTQVSVLQQHRAALEQQLKTKVGELAMMTQQAAQVAAIEAQEIAALNKENRRLRRCLADTLDALDLLSQEKALGSKMAAKMNELRLENLALRRTRDKLTEAVAKVAASTESHSALHASLMDLVASSTPTDNDSTVPREPKAPPPLVPPAPPHPDDNIGTRAREASPSADGLPTTPEAGLRDDSILKQPAESARERQISSAAAAFAPPSPPCSAGASLNVSLDELAQTTRWMVRNDPTEPAPVRGWTTLGQAAGALQRQEVHLPLTPQHQLSARTTLALARADAQVNCIGRAPPPDPGHREPEAALLAYLR